MTNSHAAKFAGGQSANGNANGVTAREATRRDLTLTTLGKNTHGHVGALYGMLINPQIRRFFGTCQKRKEKRGPHGSAMSNVFVRAT